MPFYEYECENCKFYVELLQKVSDPPLKKCPSCGKNKVKKLVSAPVFRLKGGGWYETDFKGDKENKRNLAVDKEPETSSDTKPAAAASSDSKATDTKPAVEAKASEPKATESRASGGGASGGGSRKGESRPAAAKSRAPAKAAAKSKSKAKSPARRKGR